ncbi:hypothetical protein MHY87_03540 [Microvirga sp. ACRRW]|nr:hypothetical protein [Microvirga sp. ACRRW]MCG7391974.1 hypothetical protein [Microvirga sp. ACRRW]
MGNSFGKFRDAVAIGSPSHVLASGSFRLHAAFYHFGSLFTLHLSDKPEDTNLDGIHSASAIHGPNLYAEEFQSVGNEIHIAHRARQARKAFYNDVVEFLVLRCLEQFLDAGTSRNCSPRDAPILVGVNDIDSFIIDEFPAESKLVLNRLIVLIISGKPTIKNAPLHCCCTSGIEPSLNALS